MAPKRIKSKQELLEYTIARYRVYKQAVTDVHTDQATKFYLADMLADMLLIQNYASGKDVSEERTEGMADLS